MADKILTEDDIARRYGVTKPTVHRWRYVERLHFPKPDGYTDRSSYERDGVRRGGGSQIPHWYESTLDEWDETQTRPGAGYRSDLHRGDSHDDDKSAAS